VSVPLPTPLDQLGSRRFSFYPPILDIEHNEWIFRRATSSEIQVVNTRTAAELSIPRRFIGEVSIVGEPVVIVGLVKELEFKAGAVYPHVRRVIEMPRAVNDSAHSPTPRPQRPAAVVGIRVEPDHRSRMWVGIVAAAMLACVAVLTFSTRVELPFTAQDDYDSIVARLGRPAQDQTFSSSGEKYRRLAYSFLGNPLFGRRSFTLILIDGRYAGAIDTNGRVIHAVRPLKHPR
jgi:hypothetical protein